MGKYIITGGKKLQGSIRVGGAKNAVLPILAASLLCDGEVLLTDCPALLDVDNMLEILRCLGCKAVRNGSEIRIDSRCANSYVMPSGLSKQLRSSIFTLGPILAKFGFAHAAYPGGCEIGNRPIDLHLRGLSMLNVKITEEHGHIFCDGRDMRGNSIHLDYPSVGATENVMMAAVAAKGLTVIHNAAREPEIEDLQAFLCAAGFRVSGAGSSTVVIEGGGRGHGVIYRIMPDRIVAGTLMCAAAMTQGDVEIVNAVPTHVGPMISKLRECGCDIFCTQNSVRVCAPKRLHEIKLIETLPYPGFPTDMQAQFFALCTVAEGTSILVENVFENRFKHAPELACMGASFTLKDRTAIIRGAEKLTGADVVAHDLRGGAALVLAALCAQGQSRVHQTEYIARGYENLDCMLRSLGAEIVAEDTTEKRYGEQTGQIGKRLS